MSNPSKNSTSVKDQPDGLAALMAIDLFSGPAADQRDPLAKLKWATQHKATLGDSSSDLGSLFVKWRDEDIRGMEKLIYKACKKANIKGFCQEVQLTPQQIAIESCVLPIVLFHAAELMRDALGVVVPCPLVENMEKLCFVDIDRNIPTLPASLWLPFIHYALEERVPVLELTKEGERVLNLDPAYKNVVTLVERGALRPSNAPTPFMTGSSAPSMNASR